MASQEGTNQDQMVDAGIDQALSTHYIDETLESDQQVSRVLALFRKAGMRGYLHGPDLVTLFAPLNDALADAEKLGEEQLSSLLRRHMLGRAVTEAELRTSTEVETLERMPLKISREGGQTRVGGARILRPDIECTNGVIHVVEGILKEG